MSWFYPGKPKAVVRRATAEEEERKDAIQQFFRSHRSSDLGAKALQRRLERANIGEVREIQEILREEKERIKQAAAQERQEEKQLRERRRANVANLTHREEKRYPFLGDLDVVVDNLELVLKTLRTGDVQPATLLTPKEVEQLVQLLSVKRTDLVTDALQILSNFVPAPDDAFERSLQTLPKTLLHLLDTTSDDGVRAQTCQLLSELTSGSVKMAKAVQEYNGFLVVVVQGLMTEGVSLRLRMHAMQVIGNIARCVKLPKESESVHSAVSGLLWAITEALTHNDVVRIGLLALRALTPVLSGDLIKLVKGFYVKLDRIKPSLLLQELMREIDGAAAAAAAAATTTAASAASTTPAESGDQAAGHSSSELAQQSSAAASNVDLQEPTTPRRASSGPLVVTQASEAESCRMSDPKSSPSSVVLAPRVAPLTGRLFSTDPRVVLDTLQELQTLLTRGQVTDRDMDIYADSLETLQCHANSEIYEMAVRLLDTHFDGEDVDDLVTEPTSVEDNMAAEETVSGEEATTSEVHVSADAMMSQVDTILKTFLEQKVAEVAAAEAKAKEAEAEAQRLRENLRVANEKLQTLQTTLRGALRVIVDDGQKE